MGSQLISHEKLASGHGFSFIDQPELRSLFQNVQDVDTPLTMVVGAGVSMNAGLHSWKQLLENMVRQIKDEDLRRMALQDISDPMRKAELILQLIKKNLPIAEDPRKLDAKIIRAALYPRKVDGKPGFLAQSIARLVVARNRNVRIITTNFDTLLEKALREYFHSNQVMSFSMDEVDDWKKWGARGRIVVLHVHGVVRQGRSRARFKGPIVLTESQFFRSGAKVRRVIAENLEDSNAMFVGLSMADPNLVGPMYETRQQPTSMSRYALAVPDHTAGAEDSIEATRYAIEAAEFMKRELDLSTIFLRSYSQLNQVISDLSLAIVEPDRYRPGAQGAAGSLVYENRLPKALDDCYSRIGCPGAEQQIPMGRDAEILHDRLYDALQAPNGPAEVLRRFAESRGAPRIGEPDGENLALFLWLKCRSQGGQPAPYALNLVATSAYIHREAWSIRWWEQPIVRESEMVAVNAIFLGTKLATNLIGPAGTRIWRGIMACPIVKDATATNKCVNGVPLDTVTVGAITLNSTHYVDKHDPRLPRTGRSLHEDHSAIIALDTQETERVFASVTEAAKRVLTGQTG